MNGFKEVVSGVFMANGTLPDVPVIDPRALSDLSPPRGYMREAEASGEFLTATDFGRAGVDAGKSINYGQGVMRDIALQMVGLEASQVFAVNGKGRYLLAGTDEYELAQTITMAMVNPDLIKHGSRNRLLLETGLVYEVWRAGEGHPPVDYDVPRLGKVGHKVVSMVMLFRPDFVEARLASEPDEQ